MVQPTLCLSFLGLSENATFTVQCYPEAKAGPITTTDNNEPNRSTITRDNYEPGRVTTPRNNFDPDLEEDEDALGRRYFILSYVINRLIFIGSVPPSAQSIDADIHWLARAFQCI